VAGQPMVIAKGRGHITTYAAEGAFWHAGNLPGYYKQLFGPKAPLTRLRRSATNLIKSNFAEAIW